MQFIITPERFTTTHAFWCDKLFSHSLLTRIIHALSRYSLEGDIVHHNTVIRPEVDRCWSQLATAYTPQTYVFSAARHHPVERQRIVHIQNASGIMPGRACPALCQAEHARHFKSMNAGKEAVHFNQIYQMCIVRCHTHWLAMFAYCIVWTQYRWPEWKWSGQTVQR